MRLAVCIAAVITASVLSGHVLAAEDANAVKQKVDQENVGPQNPDQQTADRPAAERQKSKKLEALGGEVRRLVRRYYPDATVVSYYDPKSKTDKIHVAFNTQIYIMRFRGEDGQWKKPEPVLGPYVGGIWCDIELLKGRYAGKIPDAEEGYTDSQTGVLRPLGRPILEEARPPSDGHVAVSGRDAPRIPKVLRRLGQEF